VFQRGIDLELQYVSVCFDFACVQHNWTISGSKICVNSVQYFWNWNRLKLIIFQTLNLFLFSNNAVL